MTYAIYLKRAMVITLLSVTLHQPSALFAQSNSPEIPSETTQESFQNLFWSWVRVFGISLPDNIYASAKDEQGRPIAGFIQSNLMRESGAPAIQHMNQSLGSRISYLRSNFLWVNDSIWAYRYGVRCIMQSGPSGSITINDQVVRGSISPQGCHPSNVREIDDLEVLIDGQVFSLSNSSEEETLNLSGNSALLEIWQSFSPDNSAINSDRVPSHFSVSSEIIAALQNSDKPEIVLRTRISGTSLVVRVNEETVRDLQMMYPVAEN